MEALSDSVRDPVKTMKEQHTQIVTEAEDREIERATF